LIDVVNEYKKYSSEKGKSASKIFGFTKQTFLVGLRKNGKSLRTKRGCVALKNAETQRLVGV
jgi:hypothetical protein